MLPVINIKDNLLFQINVSIWTAVQAKASGATATGATPTADFGRIRRIFAIAIASRVRTGIIMTAELQSCIYC